MLALTPRVLGVWHLGHAARYKQLRVRSYHDVPTEPIGSIPRPPALIEAVADRGGRTDDPALKPLFDDAIRDTIARFEATGSPVVTDGEQRKYHNFWDYCVNGMPNMAPDGFRIPFSAGHTRRMPRLTQGPFRYKVHADSYLRVAQRYAKVAVKQAVISPSALSLLYPADEIATYPRTQFIEDLLAEHVGEVRRCLDRAHRRRDVPPEAILAPVRPYPCTVCRCTRNLVAAAESKISMTLDPVTLAAHAADANAFERALLLACERTVGCDVAFFAVPGETPTTLGLDAGAISRAIESGVHSNELAPVKLVAAQNGGVAIDTLVLGDARVQRSAYYLQFMRPIGARHSLFAYPNLRGQPLGLLMLGRSGSCFGSSELTSIASALQSIAVARASFPVPVVFPPLPLPAPDWARYLPRRARPDRIIARAGGPQRCLTIRDCDGQREIVATHGECEFIWSRAQLSAPWRSGWFYVELFQLAAARALRRRRALFLGCGGAVAVRQFKRLFPHLAIDIVEIDPTVLSWADRWYDLAAISGVVTHCADAAAFVRTAPSEHWDMVIVDAYDGCALSTDLSGLTFMRELARVLSTQGALGFNVVGTLRGNGPVQLVERAARQLFSEVRLVPVLDQDDECSPDVLRNVVVLGSKP
jgi:hypothetical protein